jgi:hypothetical protein
MSHQQEAQTTAETGAAPADAATTSEGGGERARFTSAGAIPPVQRKPTAGAGGAPSASDRAFGDDEQTHAIADEGVASGGGALPHADQIAASFGRHAPAVHGISAHVGGKAAEATGALGAEAYANGNSVAFAKSPDLHTAAHEAAHVVQQRAGVQVAGGVGAEGDSYEAHANEVADRVVAGKSAEDVLDTMATQSGGGDKAVQSKSVQFLGSELGKPLPAGSEAPLKEMPDQRQYSVEAYERMWQKEQGKQLTPENEKTISRGCIGLTANNIDGKGNPLQYAESVFGDFDSAHKFMEGRNKELHEMRADPAKAAMAPQGEYILFAKQFWSNQKDGDNSQADPTAFKEDPKSHRVDMSTYKYKARPGFVNFDYGFWDDSSQSFWHANHSQPNMLVFQSTKEHFIAGYTDFDRCVFGVALAHNYDPAKAAMNANAGAATAGGAAGANAVAGAEPNRNNH